MLFSASCSPSAGRRRGFSRFCGAHQDNRDVLTEESGRCSWCPCFLSPAGYVRVRRLSPRSPSCMFQRTVPRLSSAEASGAGLAGPCVTQKESRGLVRCFYGVAPVSGVSRWSELSILHDTCTQITFHIVLQKTKCVKEQH